MSLNQYRVKFHAASLADTELARFHALERQVAGFYLTETNHPPGFVLPTHSHDNPSFYLVLGGSFTEKHEGEMRECKAATVVFTPSGEPHSNLFHQAGARCFIIEIAPLWLNSIHQDCLCLDRSAEFRGGSPVWLAARAYNEACRLDSLSPLVIEGLMLELLADTSRRQTRLDRQRPQWLERAREILHTRCTGKLSIGDIARAVDIHPVHLAAQFRRNFGCTIGDYLRRLRVELACEQISTTEAPLAEIALSAGFFDQSHFSKVFKSQVGLTPTQYREHFGLLKSRPEPLSDTRYSRPDVV